MNTARQGPRRLLMAAQRLETMRRNTTKGDRVAGGARVQFRTAMLSPWSPLVEFANDADQATHEADAAMVALLGDSFVQALIRMLRTASEDVHWDQVNHSAQCGSCERLAAAVAVADHLALGDH